ncbi:MAG: helical backbone metal receptor [Rubrivivax sp.]|jgi:ABC-type Fe3+-hydroxamate transport system substrate-binding protein|nr:helical backbone metal receptor [Rubrivivax sp.]
MSRVDPRIACLVPSVTELLFALGLGPCVVARTGFCIHPGADVRGVPKVGGTKDVRIERLRRLAPTHVVVNVDENRLETVEALREFVPQVIVTHPCAPEDNLALYAQIVEAFDSIPGVRERAEHLADELRRELEATQPGPPTDVLYLIWKDPWMTVARDTYISRLLARVGWRTWPALEGGPRGAARYPVLHGDEPGIEEVREILLPDEPYRFGPAHVAAAQRLAPRARVHRVDGELLSWYGPRAAAGLRYLRVLANAC